MKKWIFALSCLVFFSLPALAQGKKDSSADVDALLKKIKALAKKGGHYGPAKKSSKKSTATHKVVVKNGKVVINEKTKDGKVVKSSGKGAAGPKVKALLKKLRKMLKKSGHIPPGKGHVKKTSTSKSTSKATAKSTAKSSGKSSKSSTSTHKKVVKNGKVVVDKKTKNGKSIGSGGKLTPAGKAKVEALLKKLRELMKKKGSSKSSKSSTSKSSSTHKKVVKNGKVIVDKKTESGESNPELDKVLKELKKKLEMGK